MTPPFIIDAHAHLGLTKGFRAPFTSAEDIVRVMDSTFVEVLVFSSMELLSQQLDGSYRSSLRALEAFPERLRAYTVFDPNWADKSLRVLQEHQDLPGFVGIKIHPAMHAVAAEDPRYTDVWEYANEKSLVILTHSWAPDPHNPNQDLSTPDRFEGRLEKYPNVKLILGHTGGRMEGHMRAVAAMKKYPNCWADISGDTLSLGLLEWLVEQLGSDRLLFGTDANWIEPRFHIGRVLKARLPAQDRLNILRDNALRLFGESLIGNPARRLPAEVNV